MIKEKRNKNHRDKEKASNQYAGEICQIFRSAG